MRCWDAGEDSRWEYGWTRQSIVRFLAVGSYLEATERVVWELTVIRTRNGMGGMIQGLIIGYR